MDQSIVTITLSGGLDISRYPEIVDAFNTTPDGGTSVIVDLSGATWVDSIFMTELLLFYRRNAKIHRDVIIVAQGNVARMLAIAGLNKRIPIVSDFEHAIDWPRLKKQLRRHKGPPLGLGDVLSLDNDGNGV